MSPFNNQSQRSQPQQPATTQTVRQLFLSLSLSQEVGTLRALCKCKRALVAGNGLLLLQQISGQPSVLYYAVTVFKSAGFGKSSSTLASVGAAAVKLLATVLASLKVDDFARRLLLMVGISGMAGALGVIGLAFHFGYTSDVNSNQSSASGSLSEAWGLVRSTKGRGGCGDDTVNDWRRQLVDESAASLHQLRPSLPPSLSWRFF